MAKKSKKIAAAIAAGLAAYGASKMFGKKGIGEKAASAWVLHMTKLAYQC